jgi:hypothetical protein
MTAALDFSGSEALLRDTAKGLLLKPLLENFIGQAKDLTFPGVPKRAFGDRPYDGLFHPSTHPLWPDRALFAYLTNPELVKREPMDYGRRMSVTVGTALHGFCQWCLQKAGVLPAKLQRCTICPPEDRCREPGFVDDLTGAKTHADGVLALPGRYGQDLFELKTAAENTWAGHKRLLGLEDLDNEAFAQIWPDYWIQAIDVQRISGKRRTILLILVLGFPWTIKEFHIEWDPVLGEALQEKYLRVRAAARAGRAPACACDRLKRATCPGKRFC